MTAEDHAGKEEKERDGGGKREKDKRNGEKVVWVGSRQLITFISEVEDEAAGAPTQSGSWGC